jgi:hypothetical protein
MHAQNELMVKKLSMLGCTFLLLLNAFGGTSKQNPLAGMLMAGVFPLLEFLSRSCAG